MAKQVRKKTTSIKTGVNQIRFSDKSIKSFSPLLHEAEGVSAVVVPVTYTLQKSGDVAFLSLSIGFTHIDLDADQDPSDPDSFSTRGGKKYMCLKQDDGIQVTARANGKAGGSWSLNVTMSGAALIDNPIKATTDKNGDLDHDAKHN